MPGIRFEVETIAPITENTHLIGAGPVRFGVEYRYLNESTADVYFQREDEDGKMRSAFVGHSDEGLALHVFDAESGQEVLRFDCFRDEPHYHYIYAAETPVNDRVDFDEIANEGMYMWALLTLRKRMPEMIAQTNRSSLATRCAERRSEWIAGLEAVDRYVAEMESLQSSHT